jgi:hypothetical protein
MVGQLPEWIGPGVSFRLRKMGDDPDPVPAGSTGTIMDIVPVGHSWQLNVTWDPDVNRSLSLVWPVDEIEPV